MMCKGWRYCQAIPRSVIPPFETHSFDPLHNLWEVKLSGSNFPFPGERDSQEIIHRHDNRSGGVATAAAAPDGFSSSK